MSHAKALKKAQCESVETTIRKRRLLFSGVVQRTTSERLTRRVMFGTIPGGENSGQGRPEKNWAQCLADDLRVFLPTEESTDSSPPLFGVEMLLWPRAAKKSGKCYLGVVEAADYFMARWHRDKAQKSRLRHAAEDAKSGGKGRGGGGGGRGSCTDTAFDE